MGVQLRVERARIVPSNRIGHHQFIGPFAREVCFRIPYLPRLLIQFKYWEIPAACAIATHANCAHVAHAGSKIANLVEGIPCRHSDFRAISTLRNMHPDLKNVVLTLSERNFVTDGGMSRRCEKEDKQQRHESRGRKMSARSNAHVRTASACKAHLLRTPEFARKRSRSFTHNPPKLPLDITITRSP